MRARFGSISIALHDVQMSVDLRGPTSGRPSGAGKGALLGASLPFQGDPVGSGDFAGLVAMALILMIPVLALGGAVVGTVRALPADEVQDSELILGAAFERADLDTCLRQGVMREAQRAAGRLLIESAEDTGFDTRLELGVTAVQLIGSGIRPPLSVRVAAHCSLVRVRDGQVLHELNLIYLGGEQGLLQWSADDGLAQRHELVRAADTLAEAMVDELFLVYLGTENGVGS